VPGHDLDDGELYVLRLAVDDTASFSELVWLGREERDPQRASWVLLGLLRAGYIEIYEWFEDRQDTLLSGEEAEDVILDETNWRDPLTDYMSRWFLALATEAGRDRCREAAGRSACSGGATLREVA
jgi:hypothetical protein